MDNKYCSNCGQLIGQSSAFCENCGRQISATKYCSSCGAVMDANQETCERCGNGWNVRPNSYTAPPQGDGFSQNNYSSNYYGSASGGNAYDAHSNYQEAVQNRSSQNYAVRQGRNKWIAFLLLIFCGVFGVHKFYEGKIAMGIVYIFTAGFFGIGLFIDFFVILFKPTYY